MSLFVSVASSNARRSLTLETRSTRSVLQFRQSSRKDTKPALVEGLRQQEEQQRWSSTCAIVQDCIKARSSSSSSSRNRFFELLGVSLFALSTSAALGSSFAKTEAKRLDAVTEGGPEKCDPSSPNTNNAALMSMLATSALFMDPRVGMIYHPTDPIYAPQHHEKQHQEQRGSITEEEEEEGDDRDDDDDDDEVAVTPIETNSTANRYYDLSIRAVKGQRKYMEDTYFVAPGGRFVAVFDGHGGNLVSSYLRDSLYSLAKQALRRKQWEIDHNELGDENFNNLNNHDPTLHHLHRRRAMIPSIASHVAALRTAFMEAEEHVLHQSNWDKQGSTAVAVWVHESPESGARTLVSANVGDSRAILSRQGVAVDLTRDHKPNEEREKSRIKRLGGTIEWDALAKVHRVENLSLSRAIGDAFAKPIVSSEVEIKLYPVVEGKDEFLLLASDGLWDVMTSQEVVSYVKERFQSELSRFELTSPEDIENCKLVLRRNMARSICREAIRRGTGDNVCVLMVWLDDGGNFITSQSSPEP